MAKTTTPIQLEDIDKEARAIEAAGLRYRRISIKRAEIDQVHSATFNARFENRVNEDNAWKLALLWEQGVQLPRITVFYDTVLRKYIIVSGVHRVTGHEYADIQDPIEAFEIIIDPPGDPDTMQRIANLGTVLNRSGPLGLSHAEVLAAAIRAVEEQGQDIKTVAKEFTLQPEEVVSAIDNWKLDRELIQHGLTPSAFKRRGDKLHTLTLPSNSWMKEMQNLLGFVDKNGNPLLTGDAYANLVKQIKHEKNETARQDIVTKARTSLKTGKKVINKQPKRQNPRTSPNMLWGLMLSNAQEISVAGLVGQRATSADGAALLASEVEEIQHVLDGVRRAVKARWGS